MSGDNERAAGDRDPEAASAAHQSIEILRLTKGLRELARKYPDFMRREKDLAFRRCRTVGEFESHMASMAEMNGEIEAITRRLMSSFQCITTSDDLEKAVQLVREDRNRIPPAPEPAITTATPLGSLPLAYDGSAQTHITEGMIATAAGRAGLALNPEVLVTNDAETAGGADQERAGSLSVPVLRGHVTGPGGVVARRRRSITLTRDHVAELAADLVAGPTRAWRRRRSWTVDHCKRLTIAEVAPHAVSHAHGRYIAGGIRLLVVTRGDDTSWLFQVRLSSLQWVMEDPDGFVALVCGTTGYALMPAEAIHELIADNLRTSSTGNIIGKVTIAPRADNSGFDCYSRINARDRGLVLEAHVNKWTNRVVDEMDSNLPEDAADDLDPESNPAPEENQHGNAEEQGLNGAD